MLLDHAIEAGLRLRQYEDGVKSREWTKYVCPVLSQVRVLEEHESFRDDSQEEATWTVGLPRNGVLEWREDERRWVGFQDVKNTHYYRRFYEGPTLELAE